MRHHQTSCKSNVTSRISFVDHRKTYQVAEVMLANSEYVAHTWSFPRAGPGAFIRRICMHYGHHTSAECTSVHI